MKIYRVRIILDTLQEVFRDIEIHKEDTLEDLHNAINQSFGFDGGEMASFYLSDEEWNQGEEIVLFDVSDGLNNVKVMNETKIESVLDKENTKMIYVYDFLSMWTFYVELADIISPEEATDYPNLMFAQGQLPDALPEKKFEAEKLDELDEFEDEFGEEGFDEFNDDFGYDQNWN